MLTFRNITALSISLLTATAHADDGIFYGGISPIVTSDISASVEGEEHEFDVTSPAFMVGAKIPGTFVSGELTWMPEASSYIYKKTENSETEYELNTGYTMASLVAEPFTGSYGGPMFRAGVASARYTIRAKGVSKWGDVTRPFDVEESGYDQGAVLGVGWSGPLFETGATYRFEAQQLNLFDQKPRSLSFSLTYGF